MASRMGLVRGDIVLGKKQFSALLKHVYSTAVTAQNIKAGFCKAGIFPLSRTAVDTTQVVRVLPSADGSDATPSITPATQSSTQRTDTSTITQTPCPTCNINRVAHKKYLVTAGVIPESLANILMSPALERKEKVRRRIPLPAWPPGSADEAIDEWVQCDLCHLWFHLECAEVEEVPDTDWLCHKCCLST
ncbi:hypothetical protein G5714_002819 [Onychostoma macrolepis]|uniref:Zinc finger PHD-type domain-containing protein n=1 Tax=Onychostoma macrolepis TaxID=369639 RepID=A0A7J6D7U5_9TELE|nr:hypothetical protein G5714_002819 [Onychostoma macrolepis]